MQEDYFTQATDFLKKQTEEVKYMSNMNNYLAIHATSYIPKVNKDGVHYIPSTAMSQDFEHTRSTVHVALNHVVMGHGYGDWSETPYIIIAPFADLMKENGNPAEISAVDTYFSIHPDKGLILPADYRIVMPANDISAGKLYEIRGNKTVYKQENFTDQEEKQLVEKMSQIDAQIYQKYKTGNLENYEIEMALLTIGETGKKLYKKAKDKKAFLRGLLENKCIAMLASEARNMAVKATAEKMGFKTIKNVQDLSDTLMAVAKTAEKNNIPGNPSNKGHFNSLYAAMENGTNDINTLLYGNPMLQNKGILNSADDIKALGEELLTKNIPEKNIVIQSIINNAPLNLYNKFVNDFNHDKNYLARYDSKYNNYKTIAEWDSKTDETIRRYCNKQEQKFEQWRQQVSKLPEYKDFINKLRSQQIQKISTKTYEY